MKLPSNINAVLGLLSVLLVAFPAATSANAASSREGIVTTENGARGGVATIHRVLVDCDEVDFLVTEFVVTEDGSNSTVENYEGCYEVADTMDDDLELSLYKIDGNLTAAGGAFYASDNNGGYEEPIWFFASVAADTATQNISDSFLCFDLDLNAAEDTHPADVTNWGLIFDGSSTTSRECDIAITCGCSIEDTAAPTPAPVADDDEASVDAEGTSSAASSVTTTSESNFLLIVAGSVLLAVVNGALP